MTSRYRELGSSLERKGLYILGHFSIANNEIVVPDREVQPKAIAIIGNAGSSIWPFFKAAREERPDLTLDRWTVDTVGKIADQFGVTALYPFEGPPFWPFTQWAIRTPTLFPSPIGLTIHPVFGLWHAFRAALLHDDQLSVAAAESESPCTSCETQPCLTTCPVNAFSKDGYNFKACLGHVGTGENTCRSGGCDARKACPIGQEHRYQPDHAAFHMNQLLKAHGKA